MQSAPVPLILTFYGRDQTEENNRKTFTRCHVKTRRMHTDTYCTKLQREATVYAIWLEARQNALRIYYLGEGGAALQFQKDSCGPQTADKQTKLFHLVQTLITDATGHGT